jgi:UTP-glucose-1-phosphate uridylyltransferase
LPSVEKPVIQLVVEEAIPTKVKEVLTIIAKEKELSKIVSMIPRDLKTICPSSINFICLLKSRISLRWLHTLSPQKKPKGIGDAAPTGEKPR